jgi:trafficking protein particle complex subunit 8
LLGKHAAQKKDLQSALKSFIKLLRKSRQSAANQRAYLAEFLFHYQQYQGSPQDLEEISSLIPIPSLVDASLSIQSRDPALGTKTEEITNDESAKWAKLEKEAVTSYNLLNKTKSKIIPASSKKDYTCICAVGETIHVSFKWENMLEVPLPINNIFLDCEFDGKHVSHEISKGEEVPSRLEFPEFDIQVLADTSLDANEKRQVLITYIRSH